jgi:1-acyl-sn-glycerol-3-phosphate acyltransferase
VLTKLIDYLKLAVQVVYSALVWFAVFAGMACVIIVWAVTTMFVGVREAQARYGNPVMAFCLRLTLSRIEVIRDPDFDPQRRCMYVQNHVNVMDAHAACNALSHAFCGIMNAWQFKIPFYGRIMKHAGGIPVRPGSANRYSEIAEAARDRIAQGLSILVYPEAHRTRDGKVHEFKKGVFLMARDAGLPIVPFATRGMYEMNRKGTWLFKPSRITLYVGAPIETAGLSNDEMRAVMDRTHKIISDFAERGIIPGPGRSEAPATSTPAGS